MRRNFVIFIIMAVATVLAYAQKTTLVIDNQTPGWLSSKINYGEQLTVRNLKVTGYINGTDLQFILELNSNRSLQGVLDLKDANIVKGGTLKKFPYTVEEDNQLPYCALGGGKRFQKLILPESLDQVTTVGAEGDSLIWTSTKVSSVDAQCFTGLNYVYIPEGIKELIGIQAGTRIVFPKSLEKVGSSMGNLIIYSFVEEPAAVDAKDNSNWSSTSKSLFYVPKGTLEKYLNSDFGKMEIPEYNSWGGTSSRPNENKFVEYYDVDSTVVEPPHIVYVGDSASLDVKIYPNDSLVSYSNYVVADTSIVKMLPDGKFIGKKAGSTHVVVTPHVFIDGLATKSGNCDVNVVAHTEGIAMDSVFYIHINEHKYLGAKTLPLNVSDNRLVYKVSDPSIAEINKEGMVFGHKRGTCTVTVKSVDVGYYKTGVINVLQAVENLKIEQHSVEMNVKDKKRLFVQVYPMNADNKKINWSSSDNTVAEIDSLGDVTAKKAGMVWIKAISEDNFKATDSCNITVIQPVEGIALDKSAIELEGIAKSTILEATVLPEDASNKMINWKSSNENVCIVSKGEVISTGYGNALAIATTVDGGFTAICSVVVKDDSGVERIDYDDCGQYKVYTIDGKCIPAPQNGINILKFKNGMTRKVVIK